MPDQYIIGNPEGDKIELTPEQIKKVTGLFALSVLKTHSFTGSHFELGIDAGSYQKINQEFLKLVDRIEKEYNIDFYAPFTMPVCIQKVLNGKIKEYQPD